MRLKYTKTALSIMISVIILTLLKNIAEQSGYNFFGIGRHYEGKKPGMKYILLWTNETNVPFVHMGQGRSGFISRNCTYTNCIVYGNESGLGSYTAFDVIVFAGPELKNIKNYNMLPRNRLPYQKYVFASIESPENYPLCFNFERYFNWSWTYKLDSEIQWGYIVIRDSHNNIIGPKKDMHWINSLDMKPVNETFKEQLKSKKKAAAWFVSNCFTMSRREGFVSNLQKVLMEYNLGIDVYGKCGYLSCSREEQDKCNKMISEDYYFYLSFENSFSEDYVTEKLLIPLQNNVVPIVYGEANYTRFLPFGSYLNARELGIFGLAKLMNDMIESPKLYAEFFRWKNHYSFHRTIDSVETNEYCKMCALLNNEESMKTISVYDKFNDWWEYGWKDKCFDDDDNLL